MKKTILSITLCLISICSFAQNIIEWAPNIHLTLADFQSNETEINSELNALYLFSSSTIDFNYTMSSIQFMLTKNFNDNVGAVFTKNSAMISAPDSATAIKLVQLAQYSFNATELYSRKLRKELYEKKGAFSNTNFFVPIYQRLQNELQTTISTTNKKTDFGQNTELLTEENKKVLEQIEAFSGFCKACDLPKKRK